MTAGRYTVTAPAFQLENGGTAVVPIQVSGQGELLGHEYHLAFDPEQISIRDVTLSEAARGAQLYWSVKGGELHIALASTEVLPVAGAVTVTLAPERRLQDGERVRLDFTRVRLNEQDVTATARSGGGTGGKPGNLPTRFDLAQNHPNPFNPTTTIQYSIPAGEGTVAVSIRIYDVAGHLVRDLVNQSEGPGIHSAVWDGRDERGERVGSGVYFYRMRAGSFNSSRKMVVLK
jgi:hypothetical protein